MISTSTTTTISHRMDRAGLRNLRKLSRVIPEEYRKNVIVNLHGWYDYLGRYCYDVETKEMDDNWNAFNSTSLQASHDQGRHAQAHPFRKGSWFSRSSILCRRHKFRFGSSRNTDKNGKPRMRKGLPIKCWMGPGVIAQTYAMDPSNQEVKQWFLDRMEVLLKEFGTQVDAFVWDETFQFGAGMLTKTENQLCLP